MELGSRTLFSGEEKSWCGAGLPPFWREMIQRSHIKMSIQGRLDC